jgi:hypothetical protein
MAINTLISVGARWKDKKATKGYLSTWFRLQFEIYLITNVCSPPPPTLSLCLALCLPVWRSVFHSGSGSLSGSLRHISFFLRVEKTKHSTSNLWLNRSSIDINSIFISPKRVCCISYQTRKQLHFLSVQWKVAECPSLSTHRVFQETKTLKSFKKNDNNSCLKWTLTLLEPSCLDTYSVVYNAHFSPPDMRTDCGCALYNR